MIHEDYWLPRIDSSLCNGCGACVPQCPTGALAMREGKAELAHPNLCIYCSTCEDLCPTNAIELPFLIIKQSDVSNIS